MTAVECTICSTTLAVVDDLRCTEVSRTEDGICFFPVLFFAASENGLHPLCAVHVLSIAREHNRETEQEVFELVADATWRKK